MLGSCFGIIFTSLVFTKSRHSQETKPIGYPVLYAAESIETILAERKTSFSKDTSKNIVEYHETQEIQIVTGWVFVYIWLAAMTRPKNERYENLMATGILRGGEHPKIYNKKERVNRSSQRFRRNGCQIVSMYHCFLRSAVYATPASLGDFLRVIKININYILSSSILMLFI